MFILLNNMNVLGIFVFLLAILQIKGQIESPCPKYFVFEPDKTDDDRWYGIITLTSRKNLNGLTVDLEFDKSIIQLGNWLGSVTSDRDNIRFTIKSSSKQIRANEPLKIEIFVVYDPYYDVVPPKLLKIRLNGREICPNYEEEQEETVIFGTGEVDRPTILLNINVPTCGVTIATTVELITSGQTTKPGEYPWHAALYLKEGRKRKYLCGGSLISEQHVITAAHCTTVNSEARNPKEFIIILGKHTFSKQDSTEQHFTVIKIDVHEKFNKANFFNDISILHLNKPAEYTDYVRPICLWDEDISLNSVVNRTGTAVGFGRDHNENPNTEFLMQAQMPVVSQLQCIRSYPQYYGAFTTEEETNFCAGFRNGTSVCNGDSGGGLAFPKKGTKGANAVYQLRGIVSNTVSDRGVCDTDYYVIFTDVAKYLEWIAKMIKPS